MGKRVEPLADVVPVYERELSTYPDAVRLTMEDGKVITYRIDIQQPAPAFTSALETVRKWNQQDVGYQAKHAKPEGRWERFKAAMRK